MKWKKWIAVTVVAALAVGLAGCGAEKEGCRQCLVEEKVKLTVFAAASMTETLNQIAKDYEKATS